MQTPLPGSSVQPTFREQESPTHGLLDRTISLSGISLYSVAWLVIGLIAVALRLIHLDRFALSPSEAMLAFDGWNLYSGTPLDPGQSLPNTQPLIVLLESLSFFLFGANDVAARIFPALAGIAFFPVVAMLRPVVGRAATIGMALFVAISPTMVYTSRLVDGNILLALSALLIVVAVCRAGVAVRSGGRVGRWAATAGLSLALLLASGPESVSILIALAVGLIVSVVLDPDRATVTAGDRAHHQPAPSRNSLTLGISSLTTVPANLIVVLVAFVITALTIFTRLFSDLSAIAGLGDLFVDWGRLIGSGAPAVPTQYYLLVVLLYELLALVFAVVGITMPRPGDAVPEPDDRNPDVHLQWPFFVGWFAGTLVLFAFSSGRDANGTIQVVLPLLLIAGIGLGRLVETIDWRAVSRGGAFLLIGAALGIVAGLVATAVLASDGERASASTSSAVLQIVVVLVMVVGGMIYLSIAVAGNLRRQGYPIQFGRMILIAVLLLLGAITIRSTTELNSYNLASGDELIAQQTPTEAVPALVNRLKVLSRDVSVNRTDVTDPLGQHSLRLLIDPSVEWPFRWYFREYTALTIGPPSDATAVDAEVIIGPEGSAVDSAGYTPQTYTFLNRVPAAYAQPSFGDVLRNVFVPTNWDTGTRFLFFRELQEPAVPTSLVVGYDSSLSTRLFQTSAPTNLFSQSGFGSGDGQVNEPRGIAVSNDGETIYVVDSLNARVELFDPAGTFISSWGGVNSASDLTLGLFQPSDTATFGAGDIVSGPNDLVYVADTWNHVVVVVSPDGEVIRSIGVPGEPVDLGDDPANVGAEPGTFFGPRAVAVTDSEIYVTDTGNERIQVFGLDGTFLRAFGGFGTEPGHLIEPVGVAVDESGIVYVADSGNARISVFSSDGTPLTQWPVDEWSDYRYDPATDFRPNFEPNLFAGPDGLIYVTSRITSSVLVFTPDGQRVGNLTAIGGQDLLAPVGITISDDGNLYVTDVEANDVLQEPISQLGLDVRQPPPIDATPENVTGATPAASDLAPRPSGSDQPVRSLPILATPEIGTPAATPADVATPVQST